MSEVLKLVQRTYRKRFFDSPVQKLVTASDVTPS